MLFVRKYNFDSRSKLPDWREFVASIPTQNRSKKVILFLEINLTEMLSQAIQGVSERGFSDEKNTRAYPENPFREILLKMIRTQKDISLSYLGQECLPSNNGLGKKWHEPFWMD